MPPSPRPFPEPTLGDDLSALVNDWMLARCGAHLRGFQKAREPYPDVDDLADWIEAETFEHGVDWIDLRREKYRLGYADVTRLSHDAAAFALQEHDPEVYLRAARGGSRSRRPPVYNPALLDDVGHLSRREAAAALGCSEATIARLRRARRPPEQERSRPD